MKKFTGKIFAGVFTAAIMASAAFVTVGAADYSANPDYGKPAAPAVEVKKDDVATAVAAAKDNADVKVVEIKVEDDKGAKLSKDVVTEIKGSTKPVAFKNDEYTVTIDPKKVTDKVPENIDLSMGVTPVAEETKLAKDVTVPAGAVMVVPAAKGDFGMTVQVTVPANGIDKTKAKLYYVADDGKVTEVKDALKFEGDNAVITISHASSYVISEEAVKGKEGSPDTGVTLPIALVALAGGSVAVSAIAAKKRK